jgi:hypothetical protein
VPNPRLNSRPALLPTALAGCALLAAISLLAPIAPLYDPWAWLVWGRELTGLELDTSAGPSWKPLPVLITAPLSAFGDAAPDLWLLVARAAWLAVPVLAFRLAVRLEGSGGGRALIAGAGAAIGVLLLADEFTSWIRQGAGGLVEPMLAAVVLGAIEAGLARRTRLALALAFAACLLRPEAWPFALLYVWREARGGRVSVAAGLLGAAAVAALWFVPDLVGAGNALEGAGRARGADNSPLEVLGWAAEMPLAALWAGVAVALWPWRGRLGLDARWLAAGAGAWIALVALMAAAGYAGLPRFMAPAVVVLCAVGAAGLVRGVLSARRWAVLAAVVVGLGFCVQASFRAAEVPGELELIRDDSAVADELADLAASERQAFVGCGGLWTSVFLAQTQLAWELERSIDEIVTTSLVPPPDGRLVVGPATTPALAARMRGMGSPLAAGGGWEVFGTGACAPAQPLAGAP